MRLPSTALAALVSLALAGCASSNDNSSSGGLTDKETAEEMSAGEESVALEGVPPAVRKAAEAAVPGLAADGAAKETDEGKVYFEISGTADGARVDVTVTPEGEVVCIERRVPADSVPEAARAAALKRLPGLVVDKAEKIWKKERTYYELRGKVGTKVYEIALTDAGEVLEVEE
jgi:hypothetical protein